MGEIQDIYQKELQVINSKLDDLKTKGQADIEIIKQKLTNVEQKAGSFFTDEWTAVKTKINSLSTKQKTNIIVWVAIGIVLLALVITLFFRKPLVDTSAFDQRIKQRDSIIAVKQNQIVADSIFLQSVTAENQALKRQNVQLVNDYIANQEKHVIINHNIDEVSNFVNHLSKDSLRRAVTNY